MWGHFAGIATSGNVDNYERSQMPTEGDLKKSDKLRDAEIAKLITKRAVLPNQEDEILWLAMQIVTPTVFEVVCNWLREKDMVELESKVRDYYPVFNSTNYLDRDRKQILVVKEQIKTIQVKQTVQVGLESRS